MVSVTLSVPETIRKVMKIHDEINWSGFVRKAIEQKARELERLKAFKKKLKKEETVTDWAVNLQQASRTGRLEALRKKGLL